LSKQNKIPALYVFLWILLSTLLVSGTALMGWLYYLHVRNLRLNDEQYNIVAIIQKNAQKEALKTVYLAQLLDLSLDQPISIYMFDEEEGEKKLIASPLIKKVKITKIRPGTLYIDYQVRTPMAYLGEYSNTAIDQEGYLFPFQPFFTPKVLPAIYFSRFKSDVKWGESLKTKEEFQLAINVLKKLQSSINDSFYIKQLDVSQAFSENYGQRQIVVALGKNESRNKTEEMTYLRLNPDNYQQNLDNFITLQLYATRHQMKCRVIDFRLSQLAFIQYLENHSKN